MGVQWWLLLVATTLFSLILIVITNGVGTRAKRTESSVVGCFAWIIWLVGLGAVISFGLAVMHSIVPTIIYLILNFGTYFTLAWLPVRLLRPLHGKPDLPSRTLANEPYLEFYHQANKLTNAVYETLRHTPISSDQKSSIRSQVSEIPNNIAHGLVKLDRLQRMGETLRSTTRQGKWITPESAELRDMQTKLVTEMERAIEILRPIPISLIKVELAHDDRTVTRILADLDESNKRMRDLAASHEEVNRFSL